MNLTIDDSHMCKPKVLPLIEDTVQCFLYSINPVTDDSYWNSLKDSVHEYVENLSNYYIWHKEKFHVCLPISSLNSNSSGLPPHLHSITQFGDNLEDEWYITHLIQEITKAYDVVAQINDSDGEFLLIEAAKVLPGWANPGSTENRIFIYKGNIHLIPPNIINTNKKVSIEDALKAIVEFPNETRASPDIQLAINNRIGTYPQKFEESLHRAVVELPLSIATILRLKPALISAITDAYCNRDNIETRQCKKNLTSIENKINTTVTFTRCLYAMLTHAKPLNNFRNLNKKADISQKLIFGYHMIMNRATDVFSSKQWSRFLKSLNDVGYFKGNLEGSKDYVQLLEKAKLYYTSFECSSSTNIAIDVKELLNTTEYKVEYEKLQNDDTTLIDDSDEWLNIDPGQLDDLLKSRYGKEADFTAKGLTPHTLTAQLTTFLKESSDFEGIGTDHAESDEINFDADAFGTCLRDILDEILPQNELDHTSEDEFSNDESGTDSDDMYENELKKSLKGWNDASDAKNTLVNFTQSVKEEGSHSGPSSILLKQIGVSKIEMLDSDDEES